MGGPWVDRGILTVYGISLIKIRGKLGPSEGPIEAAGIRDRSADEALLRRSSFKVASTSPANASAVGPT
jgi:hypothetical protein